MATEVRLPELGENISSGDVVKVSVAVGDTVEKEQALLELETDKASFDVPSPIAGTVKEIRVEEGGIAKVGEVIMLIEQSGDVAAGPEAGEVDARVPSSDKDSKKESAPEKKEEKSPEKDEQEEQQSGPAQRESAPPQRPAAAKAPAPPLDIAEDAPVPAAPSVRAFARELGVNLREVTGTGPNGRISEDDVKAYTKSVMAGASAGGGGAIRKPLPDFSAYGEVERTPMSKVRTRTAEQMEYAWASPHVTQHDKADVTHIEDLRIAWEKKAERAGTKLTVTAIALKVAAAALRKFPQFNASIDMVKQEIVYKKYVNIGVAVDTDRGLLVPVIRDADTKNILQLSVELQELAEKARSRNIRPDELTGGCFTITNLGGIGGTAFTPIINAPEVAILGMSRSSIEPVYIEGEFEPRIMLPLSLSYDHRIIDGADAVRFLRWIAEAMEEPLLMALEG
jgi:pyruvate dehydrogenase E2 component (dihydrolipoamide acetyltransferase)